MKQTKSPFYSLFFLLTLTLFSALLFSCGRGDLTSKDPSLSSAALETGGKGFTVSTIGDNTTEAGGTGTFTLVLKALPSADVTIAVTSSDTTEGTVLPASLTFTTTNWSTAQTVTVTGVDDNDTDGDVSYTIKLGAATSTDSNYSGIDPTDVSVVNTDNETSA